MDNKKLAQELLTLANMITAFSISDKDWERMRDLIISGKDGAGVARKIKDKNKAIARFVAGLKLSEEEPRIGPFGKKYICEFDDFGNRALELGATEEEIEKIFKSTDVPSKYTEEVHDVGNGSSYSGPILKVLISKGYKVKKVNYNGNALTRIGKDAMRRNGRKWTIGYKYELTTKNGDKIPFEFDAITDEGGGRCFYVLSEVGNKNIYSEEAGIREFVEGVMDILEEIDNEATVTSSKEAAKQLLVVAKELLAKEPKDMTPEERKKHDSNNQWIKAVDYLDELIKFADKHSQMSALRVDSAIHSHNQNFKGREGFQEIKRTEFESILYDLEVSAKRAKQQLQDQIDKMVPWNW